jgi:hypothetical protein
MKAEYERITWAEVQEAASKMFHVWLGNGEITWVEECWHHLGEADLTDNTSVLEATATALRLVTLARIYEEFCGLAWDENPETPVDYLAEDLDIDPLALGILASKASPEAFDDACDDSELREASLLAATDAQRREIYDCLSTAYGDETQLYSRMSETNQSASDEDYEDEFNLTGSNSGALSYVMNGFRYDDY